MIVPLSQEFLSPSLRQTCRGAPAFELKFLVAQTQARAVEVWIAGQMRLDPHCDSALDNSYRVSSIYCDTPDLAVFHKADGYACRKFRLRRYGNSPGVFLERKTKWGDRLVKRRSLAEPSELRQLAHLTTARDWPAFWFHRHLLARRLFPSCHVSYRRTAYVGNAEHGSLRLTIDRDIVAVPHNDWVGLPSREGRTLLDDQAILELKFSHALPVLFRRLVYELSLAPITMSKYRRAIQIWGLDGQPTENEACRTG